MIVVLNRFREDAVMCTIQDEYGRMNCFTEDFPEIRDPKQQMVIALADLLQLPEDGWAKELMKMVEENRDAIAKEVDEFMKDIWTPEYEELEVESE